MNTKQEQKATLAKSTILPEQRVGGIGPHRRSRWRGHGPEGAARARPAGCGTGRLRRRERSEWERALRASGGGAACA